VHSVHERVERLVAAESRCDHRWAIRELAIASSSWATATYERHRHDAIATDRAGGHRATNRTGLIDDGRVQMHVSRASFTTTRSRAPARARARETCGVVHVFEPTEHPDALDSRVGLRARHVHVHVFEPTEHPDAFDSRVGLRARLVHEVPEPVGSRPPRLSLSLRRSERESLSFDPDDDRLPRRKRPREHLLRQRIEQLPLDRPS